MSSARPGFTLLEAMIAVVIVGTAGVAALSAVSAELRAADRGRHALEAAALAQDRLSRIELLDVTELSPLPDSLARGSFAPPFAGYRWQATVAPVEDALLGVHVAIEWDGGAYAVDARLFRPPQPVASP